MLLYFGSFENWTNKYNIKNKVACSFVLNFKEELSLIGDFIVKYNPNILKVMQKVEKKI